MTSKPKKPDPEARAEELQELAREAKRLDEELSPETRKALAAHYAARGDLQRKKERLPHGTIDLSPRAYRWGTCLLAVLNELVPLYDEEHTAEADAEAGAVRLLRDTAAAFLEGRLPLLGSGETVNMAIVAVVEPGADDRTARSAKYLHNILAHAEGLATHGGEPAVDCTRTWPMDAAGKPVETPVEWALVRRRRNPGQQAIDSAPVIARAAEELFDLFNADRKGLDRCPAPGPREDGTCEKFFIVQERGQPRAYCSPACQRRARRWRARNAAKAEAAKAK